MLIILKTTIGLSTCEVLFTSRPTEVVSKVINASVSQIRSWCVMTQWSAVRIYSVILMRMNLSCCLPETRRLKRSQMHLLFFCFARSSIKLQSCYCWYLNVSHAAAKRKCLDSAKRWIVLSSLGKSLLELGVGCAWWCRKGKIFSWFKLLLPSLTLLHVRSCAAKWHLDTFLCSCTPPARGFPAPCPPGRPVPGLPAQGAGGCPDILPRRKEDAGSEESRSSAAALPRSRSRKVHGTAAALLEQRGDGETLTGQWWDPVTMTK